jgi:lysophospholipase L1-like esterase
MNRRDKPEEAALFQERFGGGGSPPLIFAIGGDRVGDLAWRLDHGLETIRMSPKVFVLNIGTNDLRDPSKARAKDVAAGVMTSVVARLTATWPRAKVLVLGLLPRAPREFPITTDSEAWDESNQYYRPIKKINALLEAAAVPPRVTYLDCGGGLLSEDGTRLPRTTMGDYLHPSLEGYRVLADCIEPVLHRVIRVGA